MQTKIDSHEDHIELIIVSNSVIILLLNPRRVNIFVSCMCIAAQRNNYCHTGWVFKYDFSVETVIPHWSHFWKRSSHKEAAKNNPFLSLNYESWGFRAGEESKDKCAIIGELKIKSGVINHWSRNCSNILCFCTNRLWKIWLFLSLSMEASFNVFYFAAGSWAALETYISDNISAPAGAFGNVCNVRLQLLRIFSIATIVFTSSTSLRSSFTLLSNK